jgi:hypothetical protein
VFGGGAGVEWAVSSLCDVESEGGVYAVDGSAGGAGVTGGGGVPFGILGSDGVVHSDAFKHGVDGSISEVIICVYADDELIAVIDPGL